jgi:hypothetical protein
MRQRHVRRTRRTLSDGGVRRISTPRIVVEILILPEGTSLGV